MASDSKLKNQIFVFDSMPSNLNSHADTTTQTAKIFSKRMAKYSPKRWKRTQIYYRQIILKDLHSWLNLRYEAEATLNSLNEEFVLYLQAQLNPWQPEYTHKEPSNVQPAKSALGEASVGANAVKPKVGHMRNNSVMLLRISVDRSPRISWSVQQCGFLLSFKLAVAAKLEYSKAVTSTLGGAYATMQRAGWAKMFAKQTLQLANSSGDHTLALRAKVYLKICEITAILHPSYAQRAVHADEAKGITTKTDTNVLHSEAQFIPYHAKLRIKGELKELMTQAIEAEEEAIIGLIEYAQFRVDTH